LLVTFLTLLIVGTLLGCSSTPQSPDVTDGIRKSLDQAGLKDVSVRQDRDKGVGDSASCRESSYSKTVNSDLDKGIEKNLDAALIQHRLHKGAKYDVKNGVVTLTGEVNSQASRAQVKNVASAVLNVQQG
jgi:osmotically-inducible protein OsmY